MRKNEFINIVRECTGCSRDCAERTLEEICRKMSQALASGESVGVSGFGTVRVVERKPRVMSRPDLGATFAVPPHKAPIIRFSRKILAEIDPGWKGRTDTAENSSASGQAVDTDG